ncbi:galactosyltransferase-domain-containing protein [Lobosporangium transversale]|uniref:Galactosyltransferase-domain-containing protein n=1 Tax=Lobosporangium transversale TaxID=64571 RepID=A0A1Y2GWE1_9FUNG|nr:galactosyltransferase-domain-containing protein [Lobosporangium transversale]ORZ26589.1 galactosyltransferase-domain-containing protein [Lobosporangium transversale]|eukprot:XP_021884352.1 galactosyltransferase-domain-containing protein [Lobosporangium transversale]
MKSSALDNYVGALWCLLGGLWSFWLSNSLIRRWFIHYEPRPAMIRLFTLGTFFWFSVVFFVSYFGAEEPIWPWMVICAILAVIQIIQILHFRVKGHYKLEAKIKPRRDAKSLIYRTVLIPGGIVSFITMIMLLYQNNMRPSTAEAIATGGVAGISATSDAKLVIGAAQVQVLIIILSSWAPKASQRRQEIRNTTLKLLPPSSSRFAYTYKFVLGEAPSSHARNKMGAKISAELQKYDDILLLPVSDAQEDRGYKVFKALEWSNRFKFDFLCKTDDDVFVRWDTVSNELIMKGPLHYHWKGLTFRNMLPIASPDTKVKSDESELEIYPPFVANTFYVLSRDIITLLTYPGPRIFTKYEDQNIGIWLHAFNIQPVHDRRIQQWDVCEDDMIAKHFGERLKSLESMHNMYKNVIDKKPLCTGFRQDRCAPCYSCYNRSGGHWKDRGLNCDSAMGISPLKPASELEDGLTVDIKDTMPLLGNSPDWIIPGILSDKSSIFSDTEDWSRLHWAIWTTDAAISWQARHYQAIESLFIHNPNAVLIVLSNTLPPKFFEVYTRQGYQIYILSFSKELLLQHGWHFGPETREWLQKSDEWRKKSVFFPVHLADYLRLVALYKYGGLYMDLDALWIRPPGDRITEFIGSDISDTESDRSWTLDAQNTYLANGVMRFRRGRSMFRQIANNVFTSANYDPECFNCGGPKAFTTYVKTHRISLEKNGLQILPRKALYPYSWKEVVAAIQKSDKAEDELLSLEEHGFGLHLFGKVTNKKEIEEGSVVAAAFKIWSLDLFPATSTNHRFNSSRLQGPKTLYYHVPSTLIAVSPKDSLLAKVPGTFRGIDAVFVRGDQQQQSSSPFEDDAALALKKASILITVKEGSIVMNSSGAGAKRVQMDLGQAVSMAQLNLALSHVRYLPPTGTVWTGSDQILIQVEFGSMREQLDIPVVRQISKL